MNASIHNFGKSPQWVIYSSHDVTVGTVLAALNLWNAECIYDSFKHPDKPRDTCVTEFPPFASSVVF